MNLEEVRFEPVFSTSADPCWFGSNGKLNLGVRFFDELHRRSCLKATWGRQEDRVLAHASSL